MKGHGPLPPHTIIRKKIATGQRAALLMAQLFEGVMSDEKMKELGWIKIDDRMWQRAGEGEWREYPGYRRYVGPPFVVRLGSTATWIYCEGDADVVTFHPTLADAVRAAEGETK